MITNFPDSMDDEDDDMSSPWADGQCSRTSGYQRSRAQVTETQVKKTMTSFNISSLVRDSSCSSSSVSRPGVPVGVVTARQRVTTTDMEIVTSLAPAPVPVPPSSFLSASQPSLVTPQPLLPPHHLMPPPLVTSLPPLHPVPGPPPAPPALYPPAPPYMFGFPDPHYYYFLQQQLLMLQHHHYLQSQVPALRGPSVPNPAANINFLQSLENSVNSLKNPEAVKQVDDGIIVDKLIHNTDTANTESRHDIRQETNDGAGHVLEVESSQKEEVSAEKSDEYCDHPEDVIEATDESFINVDDEDDVSDPSLKCQEDTSGLNLLAESIDKLEDPPAEVCSSPSQGAAARKLRFASTDCVGLQILSDVADTQQKITPKGEKTERSKSVDCDSRRKEPGARVDVSKSFKMQNDIAQMGKNCTDLSKKLVRMERLKKKKIKIKKSRQREREVEAAERLHAVSEDERESDALEESSEKEDSSGVGVNILTSFTETFQKFKKSYLSKNAADSKQTQNVQKKIPTLENWTTIMQEKKLKKETEVQETGFNNNMNVKIEETVSESKLVTTVQRTVISSVKEDCCSVRDVDQKASIDEVKSINVDEDLRNNNDWVRHQNVSKENDFISLKKKIKLKKNKYKEQQKIQSTEKQSEEVDINIKKRKKKKKDKKERKEKERKEKKEKKKDKKKKTATSNVSVVTTAHAPPPVSGDTGDQPLAGCGLTSTDLTDGLRVLLRLGGHFHPARLTEISAPDIYGVVVDKERGNKPHILSREEVLQRAVSKLTPVIVSLYLMMFSSFA